MDLIKVSVLSILFSSAFLIGINCSAQVSQSELNTLRSKIAAKQYIPAALKNIELLKKALQQKPSQKEFRELQDVTSKLVTALAENKKATDSHQLAKWHYLTATRLFGEKSPEQLAAIQDIDYASHFSKDPKTLKIKEKQNEYLQNLMKQRKYQDVTWLHARNKARLSRMIDDNFNDIQKRLDKLNKTYKKPK